MIKPRESASFKSIYFKLAKPLIALPVALSAITGYVLAAGTLNFTAIIIGLGTLFMSMGSLAMNQYQERDTDALMPRTAKRPIPSGRCTPATAFTLSIILLSTGVIILLIQGGLIPALVGVLTALWYNLVYTPLKKQTSFAVVPGALTGALPLFIGFTAAEGLMLNQSIVLLSIFFFVGQIPHFWLLTLKYGKEYTLAGLPNLTEFFTMKQIRGLSLTWTLSACGMVFLMLLTGLIHHAVIAYMLFAYVIYLMIVLIPPIWKEDHNLPKHVFMKLNLLYLFLMLAIITDRLL